MGLSWIPYTKGLTSRKEVVEMAGMLGIDCWSVVGRLLDVWSWADSETQNGHMARHALRHINTISQCPDFAEAMVSVGWILVSVDGIQFVNFHRWHTEPEKQRLLKAKRMQEARKRCATNVAQDAPRQEPRYAPHYTRTRTRTIEEPPTEVLRAPPPQDEIWNCLCDIYGYTDHKPPKSKCSRFGKLVRDLKAVNATPEEMRATFAAMTEEWDGREPSPEKFVDWFPRKRIRAAAAPVQSKEQRVEALRKKRAEMFGDDGEIQP